MGHRVDTINRLTETIFPDLNCTGRKFTILFSLYILKRDGAMSHPLHVIVIVRATRTNRKWHQMMMNQVSKLMSSWWSSLMVIMMILTWTAILCQYRTLYCWNILIQLFQGGNSDCTRVYSVDYTTTTLLLQCRLQAVDTHYVLQRNLWNRKWKRKELWLPNYLMTYELWG